MVSCRFTLDYWRTTSEVVAEYDASRQDSPDGYDCFVFNIKLPDFPSLEAKPMFFCIKYVVNGQEYWDNNNDTDFQIDFYKKHLIKNDEGLQSTASRAVSQSLPRSNPRSATNGRPKSMPLTFADFADGFEREIKFEAFNQPAGNYPGESPSSALRLKGVKATTSLPTDNLTKRFSNPSGKPFANRYDFGASLSAAIQAANESIESRRSTENSIVLEKPSTESPKLASSSYNELLDKYCFVCTL